MMRVMRPAWTETVTPTPASARLSSSIASTALIASSAAPPYRSDTDMPMMPISPSLREDVDRKRVLAVPVVRVRRDFARCERADHVADGALIVAELEIHRPSLVSTDLDEQGVALTAAAADGCDAESAAALAQGMDEMDDDSRAARAQRVADRDRSAVDVDAFLFETEPVDRRERDGGERLVDLPERDVFDTQPVFVEELVRQPSRASPVDTADPMRPCAWPSTLASGVRPFCFAKSDDDENERSGAVVDARSVAGGDRAARVDRLQLRERIETRVLARRLVAIDERERRVGVDEIRREFLRFGDELVRRFVDAHRADADELASGGILSMTSRPRAFVATLSGINLVGEASLFERFNRPVVAAQREFILSFAPESEVARDPIALLRHRLVEERIPKTVVHHGIDELRVAHAIAEARFGNEVGRARHALHARRDDRAWAPAWINRCADAIASVPDAQTLLTVSDVTVFGRPAMNVT